MAGYNTILTLRRLEQEISELGFMFAYPKHGSSHDPEFRDMLAIRPKDAESLPIYSRDAELFVGTLEQLQYWVQGVRWARDYDRMLIGKTIETRRQRKEQDYRNEVLMRTLTQPEKEQS